MVSNFAEQHQYFAIFQQPYWEFDQDADFKKLVSYITTGILCDDGLKLWCHKMLNLPKRQNPDYILLEFQND